MEGKAPETSFLRNSRVDLNSIQSYVEVDVQAQARTFLSAAPPASLPPAPPVSKAAAGNKLTHLTQRFQSLDSNRMHWFVRLQALIYINDHLSKDDVRPHLEALIPGSLQPLMKQFYEKRKTFTPFLSSIMIEFAKVAPLHIAGIAHEVLVYCLQDRSSQAMDCAYTICQEVPLSQSSWEALLFFIFDQQYSNLFMERYSALCDTPESPTPLPVVSKQQLLELACENTVHYNLAPLAAQAVVNGGYDTNAFVAKEVGQYAKIFCGMFSSRIANVNASASMHNTIISKGPSGLGHLSKTVKFDENSINASTTPGKTHMSASELRTTYQPEAGTVFPPHGHGVPMTGHTYRPSIQEEMSGHPAPFGSTGGTSIIGTISGLSATPSARESIEDMIGVADVNAALENVAHSTHSTHHAAPANQLSPLPFAKKLGTSSRTGGDALEQFIKEASLGPTFFNETVVTQDADTTLNLLEHARNLVSSQSAYAADANETMNMDDLLSYVNNLSRTHTSTVTPNSRRTTNMMGVPPMGPPQAMVSPGTDASMRPGDVSSAFQQSVGTVGIVGKYPSANVSTEELDSLRQANKALELQLSSANAQIYDYMQRINEYNNALVALQTETVSVGASTQLYLKNVSLQSEIDSLKSNFDRLIEKYQALKERDRTMMDRLDKYESKQQQFKTMFEQASERYESMKRVTNEKLIAYRDENERLKMELAKLQQDKGAGPDLHRMSGRQDDHAAEISTLRAEVEALKNDKANLTTVTKRLIAKLSTVNKHGNENN